MSTTKVECWAPERHGPFCQCGLTSSVSENLEVWAFETMRDGLIGEAEFSAELPCIGALLEAYGPGPLKFLLTDLTMRGIPFLKVLANLERMVEFLGADAEGRARKESETFSEKARFTLDRYAAIRYIRIRPPIGAAIFAGLWSNGMTPRSQRGNSGFDSL